MSLMSQRVIQSPFKPRLSFLIFGLIFLFIGAAMFMLLIGDILAMIRGPMPMTVEQLVELKDLNTLSQKFITFKHDGLIRTDINLVKFQNGKYVQTEAKYVLIKIADRLLLAMMPPQENGATLKGLVWKWDMGIKLYQTGVLEDYLKKHPEYKAKLLPYHFNVLEDEAGTSKILLMMCGGLGVIGGSFLAVYFYQRSQLARFKKALAKRLGADSRYVLQ